MSNITLEGIAAVIHEELKPINERLGKVETRLATIEKTQDIHTGALEQLLTKKKTKDEEETVSAQRFERLERWAERAGEKLDIKLEL